MEGVRHRLPVLHYYQAAHAAAPCTILAVAAGFPSANVPVPLATATTAATTMWDVPHVRGMLVCRAAQLVFTMTVGADATLLDATGETTWATAGKAKSVAATALVATATCFTALHLFLQSHRQWQSRLTTAVFIRFLFFRAVCKFSRLTNSGSQLQLYLQVRTNLHYYMYVQHCTATI